MISNTFSGCVHALSPIEKKDMYLLDSSSLDPETFLIPVDKITRIRFPVARNAKILLKVDRL